MVLDAKEIKRLKGRRERILAQLRKFYHMKDSAVVPNDITQNGISTSTKISRSHVSEILERLHEDGEIREEMRHISGFGRRKKVYFLSTTGMRTAQKIA